VNFQGKAKAVTRQTFRESLHSAGGTQRRLPSQWRLKHRFLHVTSAPEELGNPNAQTGNKDHGADDEECNAKDHRRGDESNAECNYEWRGCRPRHFDGERASPIGLKRFLRLARH
jgi:hypothetical protein